MAGTEIWSVLAVIQVPTLLTIVGHEFRAHNCNITSSGEDFFPTCFELISRPDPKINIHRKSETVPLRKQCGLRMELQFGNQAWQVPRNGAVAYCLAVCSVFLPVSWCL